MPCDSPAGKASADPRLHYLRSLMIALTRTLRSLVPAVLLALPLASLAQTDSTAATCSQADGRSYRGMVTFEGTMEGATELSFRQGECSLRVGRGWGFTPGPYSCTSASDGLRVESRMESRSQGYLQVEALLNDSSMTGHFDWHKPGQEPLRFKMEGRLKQAAPMP